MSARWVVLAVAAFSSPVFAQEDAGVSDEPPPSAEMIKQVMDYLENGKARGPALLDVIACTKVDNTKGSPTQFQCVEPVTAAVKKNTTVFAWLQWYCPKDGAYEDVQVQYLLEGQVRQTIDVPVKGFGRTRGWRGMNLNKIGKWTIKVLRGDKELGTATVDVIAE